MTISCSHEVSVEIFDQRADKIVRKGHEEDMSEVEVLWKNIIFQTPGVGREKC